MSAVSYNTSVIFCVFYIEIPQVFENLRVFQHTLCHDYDPHLSTQDETPMSKQGDDEAENTQSYRAARVALEGASATMCNGQALRTRPQFLIVFVRRGRDVLPANRSFPRDLGWNDKKKSRGFIASNQQTCGQHPQKR